jgi:poly(hydroxyalkanoate) depolymerase family esterase
MRWLVLPILSGCALAAAPPLAPDGAGEPDARTDAAPPGDGAPADAPGAVHDPVDFAPLPGSFAGLRAYLHVPAGMGIGEPRPLVLVLHGCWEDAAVHAANTGWNALADARRLYVVHAEEPVQIQQCLDWWSASAQAGGGDTAGALAMIDAVAAAYDVDPARVYVAGFSSGGAVAVNLLALHPGRFAGGIVHAGLPFRGYTGTDIGTLGYIFSEHDQTPAARAAAMPGPGPYPPIVAFVGTGDTTVHPTFTRELVEQWTAVQGAGQVPAFAGRLKLDHAGHAYRTYRAGDGRLLIATVTVDAMSHGYAVDPTGATPDAGVGAAASLPGKPVYGKDVGLWSTWWAAEVLGL